MRKAEPGAGGPQHRERRPAPAYLHPRGLALVFAGGTLGVLARELLMLAVPGVALAVFIANLSGALLLGLLLSLFLSPEADPQQGPRPDPRHHRNDELRLLLGTGLLGGFTTYSALAQTVATFAGDSEVGRAVWQAAAYGLGTLLLGGLATWVGIGLGGLLTKRQGRRHYA